MEVLSGRVLLHPSDFAESLGFYRDTLGLAVYREWGEEGSPVHGVVFFMGGNYLELSRSSGGDVGDMTELWLQVRDVDAEHERLRDAGVTIVEAPVDKPWGLREMRIHDPDGLTLVVVEIPADHPLRRRT